MLKTLIRESFVRYKRHFFFLVYIDVEPVGLRTPRLISDVKSTTIEKHNGHDLSLLCQAQGYPMPTFRYLIHFPYFI